MALAGISFKQVPFPSTENKQNNNLDYTNILQDNEVRSSVLHSDAPSVYEGFVSANWSYNVEEMSSGINMKIIKETSG